jgi:hypothetical protein
MNRVIYFVKSIFQNSKLNKINFFKNNKKYNVSICKNKQKNYNKIIKRDYYTNDNLLYKKNPYNNGPKFPMGNKNFIIFLIGVYIYNREYK